MPTIHELTGQTGMIQRLAQVPTGCPRSALAPRRPDRIGAENMHANYCDVSLKLQRLRVPRRWAKVRETGPASSGGRDGAKSTPLASSHKSARAGAMISNDR
jgi:hypothetical protein